MKNILSAVVLNSQNCAEALDMPQNSSVKRPIVSICIPTYNRASQLENLFNNLQVVKAEHGDDIEICVSNNNSPDHTQQVIEAWRTLLSLKVVTQTINIGATLNCIEVTKVATGRWIQLIGDDDELNPENFNTLLNLLRFSSSETWVLVGVANVNGNEVQIGNIPKGSYSTRSFRRTMLLTGINRYGFIGMHIIPSSWMHTFQNLSFQSMESWPHLALFLRYMGRNGTVIVSPTPVVKRDAGGGCMLFWKAGDGVRVNLNKIIIALATGKKSASVQWFYDLLVLRELYFVKNIKQLVWWKAVEPSDFNRNAILEYSRRYKLFGAFTIFVTLHCILLLLIRVTPSQVLRFFMRRIGHRKLISDYMTQKETFARFDAVDRGL